MVKLIQKFLAILALLGLLAPSTALAAQELTIQASQPNNPTVLVQSSDSINPLAAGGINPTSSISLSAQISAPLAINEQDTLTLELEVKKTDTAFSFVASHQSDSITVTGTQAATASVKLSNLSEGDYHWQARVRNKAGLVSNWVAFGANSDSPLPAARDFRVDFPPSAPTGLKAVTCQSNCPTTHAVELSWTNAGDSDLNSVEVFRSTALADSGTKVATVTKPGASTIDSGLSEGTIYYYRMKSSDAVGNSSSFSDVAAAVTNIIIDEADGSRVTRTTGWSQAGKTNLLVAEKGSSDSITYRPNIPSSSVYEVFVSWVVNPDIPASFGTQTTKASYTVTVDSVATVVSVDQTKLADQLTAPATKDVPSGFFKLGIFTLSAGTGSSVKLDASSTGYVVADQSKFVYLRPVAPTNLSASDRPNDDGGAIELKWTASVSASAVAYNIYRSSTAGGFDFSKPLATVTSTSHVDATVTNDITYFYVVRATDRNAESTNSNETSAVAKDNVAPAIPTITSIEEGDGFVVLNWTKSSSAVGYTIRYRDPATEAGFHSVFVEGGETTSAKITDLSNDVRHEFGVLARDASGNESPYASAFATPKGPTVKVAEPTTQVAAVAPRKRAQAAVEEPQPEAAPSPEEGKIKAAEQARERRQKAAATVAILVVAVAAGVAGYYGYDWWLRRSQELAKPPKSKGKNGRW